MGISLEYHGNIMGISLEYHGNISGISWEYLWNIILKPKVTIGDPFTEEPGVIDSFNAKHRGSWYREKHIYIYIYMYIYIYIYIYIYQYIYIYT